MGVLVVAVTLLVLAFPPTATGQGGGVMTKLEEIHADVLASWSDARDAHASMPDAGVLENLTNDVDALATDVDALLAAHPPEPVLEVHAEASQFTAEPRDVPWGKALVLVVVTANGELVSGIGADDVGVRTIVGPAGACSLRVTDVVPRSGEITLRLHPESIDGECNWLEGTYLTRVVVDVGDRTASTVMRLDVAG